MKTLITIICSAQNTVMGNDNNTKSEENMIPIFRMAII